MRDEEIAAIVEREKAATPGPWAISGDLTVYSAAEAITTMEWASDDTDDSDLPPYTFDQHQADAAFIAYAREDIPTLLAEVKAWREIGRQLAAGRYGRDSHAIRDIADAEVLLEQVRALLVDEAAHS